MTPPLSRFFRDNLSRIFTNPLKTLGEKYFQGGREDAGTFFRRGPKCGECAFSASFRASPPDRDRRTATRRKPQSAPSIRTYIGLLLLGLLLERRDRNASGETAFTRDDLKCRALRVTMHSQPAAKDVSSTTASSKSLTDDAHADLTTDLSVGAHSTWSQSQEIYALLPSPLPACASK